MAQLKRNEVRSLLRLIYYRPDHASCTMLDGKLFDLAARYRGRLELVVRHSNECGTLFGGWVSGSAPTVLFVRDGQSVAEFIGDLPSNEIERLTKSALAGVAAEHGESFARLGRLARAR